MLGGFMWNQVLDLIHVDPFKLVVFYDSELLKAVTKCVQTLISIHNDHIW